MSLHSPPVGVPFLELQSVDSTNNYAMRLAHAGMAQHGMAMFAHYQTAGKGQRQKQWLAPSGQSIILSVVLQPTALSPFAFFGLSMAMALAAHGLFKKFACDNVTIKWPNDIYWCDRKAGGILIENIVQGSQWKTAIVGIGININQTAFEDLDNKAVSLKQITGQTYEVVPLAKELCTAIDGYFKKLCNDSQHIFELYQQQLYKKDQWVKLKKEARLFDAQIKGVTATGQLRVQHGIEELFEVGEVQWII